MSSSISTSSSSSASSSSANDFFTSLKREPNKQFPISRLIALSLDDAGQIIDILNGPITSYSLEWVKNKISTVILDLVTTAKITALTCLINTSKWLSTAKANQYREERAKIFATALKDNAVVQTAIKNGYSAARALEYIEPDRFYVTDDEELKKRMNSDF
jgi:hypothetical protein